MREIMLVQGHPYSNDNPERWEENQGSPAWFYWLVIAGIGVVIGVWLRKKRE
jgi:hypothetical protein